MADTFLAVFVGSKTGARMQAWNAMPEAAQKARVAEGMAAWHGWMERHADALAFPGGPLGKTKAVTPKASPISATAWAALSSSRPKAMRPPPSCSRTILTSPSSRAKAWK